MLPTPGPEPMAWPVPWAGYSGEDLLHPSPTTRRTSTAGEGVACHGGWPLLHSQAIALAPTGACCGQSLASQGAVPGEGR